MFISIIHSPKIDSSLVHTEIFISLPITYDFQEIYVSFSSNFFNMALAVFVVKLILNDKFLLLGS